MVGEKVRMEKYLNEKYGQEFVVENVHIQGAGLAIKGSWRAEAHPKSDPSLKFDIRRDQANGRIDYETFLQTLWSRQGSGEVENFLAKEFPNSEGYTLAISPGNPGSALYDSIRGEVPDLRTVLEKHSHLLSYTLGVRNVVNIVPNEPSEAQLESVLRIANFIKAKNITPSSYLYYNYRDASFDKYDSAGQRNYQYGIHIERGELNGIDTIADIRKFFKTLGQ